MDKITLPANLRTVRGKGAAKRLRKDGLLPAVLYGGKEKEAISLTVDESSLREILRHHSGNVLITLKVDKKGKNEYTVLLQEMQTHPYKDIIKHLDFLQVAMDQKIKVEVALNFQGEPIGQAILETHVRNLEVECLPDQIPEEIMVDISALEAGQAIHIGDLSIPAEVTALGGEDKVVAVAVERAAIEEVEEEAAEVAEGAEGEAASGSEESSQG